MDQSWLQNPVLVTADIDDKNIALSLEDSPLSLQLRDSLKLQGFDHLFPIQKELLNYTSINRDICVLAPTGSGKTLAYCIPILNGLKDRRVTRLRALIMVPGKELATQVLSVLRPLAESLALKVDCAVGQTSFSEEQRRLVGFNRDHCIGGESLVDILISTPGRLVDHLDNTNNFTLQHVEWLVFDEADRLLEGMTQDWINPLNQSLDPWRVDRPNLGLQGSISYRRPEDSPMDSMAWVTPLRKMLFSATLTRNPAKLASLELHHPVYILAKDSEEETTKYTTPKELEQFLYVCEEERKPVPIIYLLDEMNITRSICFTKSIESTEKLCILLEASLNEKRIASFSSNISSNLRKELLEKFNLGEVDLLICSDSAARGLDLSDVSWVINYDVPKYMKTYIHRVGRTARAGRSGMALTIAAIREAHHFKEMIQNSGLGKFPSFRIPKLSLANVVTKLSCTLQKFDEQPL